MAKAIRLVVADDHPIVRRGIVDTINEAHDMIVVGQGASADEAVDLTLKQQPDMVVLDVTMPGDGIEAARSIRDRCPSVRIAMLTVRDELSSVNAALQAGASGFLTKGTSGPDLIDVLRRIAKGERYVSPDLAARLLAGDLDDRRDDGPLTAELTERERQIFDLLGEGLSNADIAERLGLSLNTVKHYITPLLHKLGARNRIEVALLARQRRPR